MPHDKAIDIKEGVRQQGFVNEVNMALQGVFPFWKTVDMFRPAK
jgi:hypothetical protein